MNNTSMDLYSESGYCMPFDDRGEEVDLALAYGEQIHPQSGERFWHHGIDLRTQYYLLAALADGKVTGIGSDARHGLHVNILYGHYLVKYAHLSSSHVTFGQSVRAGNCVGVSSELLHMEVHYGEEEIDPLDFLSMLYARLKTGDGGDSRPGTPVFLTIEADVHTDYDARKEEIEELMLRFYPAYIKAIQQGSYRMSRLAEQSLRNTFTVSALKNYFFESVPSLSNPLGVGKRCAPIAGKVQNLLISDFLNYLALKHDVFLSGTAGNEKKK